MEDAIASLLKEFAWNKWFLESFWPENEFRVRLIISDLLARVPPPVRILDIGCANGFMSFLCARLGYQVTATDGTLPEQAPAMFAREGIEFFPSNLNEPSTFPAATFDAVLFGEVIEHILNHPLGLMKAIAMVTRLGGILALTTPNPATLLNAVRVARGTFSLWGTKEFIELPKIIDNQITDIGDVHFREYRTCELTKMLVGSGFQVERVVYFPFGSTKQQSKVKRLSKSLLKPVSSHRLFGANQYILAQRVS